MPENKPRPNRAQQRQARQDAAFQGIPYTLALANLRALIASNAVNLNVILASLLGRDDVEELYFNSYEDGFYIDKDGKHKIEGGVFQSPEHMIACVNETLRQEGIRTPTATNPVVDASLSDESRLHVCIAPVAEIPGFAIRRKPVFDYVKASEQTMSQALQKYIRQWIRQGKRIVFSGATGSGKTTLLNYSLTHLSDGKQATVIENTPELKLEGSNAVRVIEDEEGQILQESHSGIMVIGETRGAGHISALEKSTEGFITTIHSDYAAEAEYRMQMISGQSLATAPAPDMADIIVHVRRNNVDGVISRSIVDVIDKSGETLYMDLL